MSAGTKLIIEPREIYFANGGVTITDKRIVIDQQTFAAGALESFRTGRKESTIAFVLTIVTAVIGVLLFFASRSSETQPFAIAMLVFAAICGAWYWASRKSGIVLRFTSGDVAAIHGRADDVDDIADALTKLLMHR